MSIINIPYTYNFKKFQNDLVNLRNTFPFLNIFDIGESVLKNKIFCIKFGTGKKNLLYTSSIHSNEWITTILLLKFLENLCIAFRYGQSLYNQNINILYETCSIYFIPMINPDGVNLVNNFYSHESEIYNKALKISKNFPHLDFPSGWKANINGVDLNSQFPANWDLGKKLKSSEGYFLPAPRDFAGYFPISEPESKALYSFSLTKNFYINLNFHSQGEVIYWKYKNIIPKKSYEIAKEFAHFSGYELAQTPYLSSFGGFRDWFIENFNTPAYTIEIGSGINPLPISQFNKIYNDNLGILTSAGFLI